MPEWGRIPGMLCTQTLQRAALLSVARRGAGGGGGPSLWSLFCACWERFSSGCGACPWSCGFDTEALLSAKDSISELQGSLRCLLCCCNFILGKFLRFPGDEAWAALAPAGAIPEGLESCFVIRVSKRGCGARESPSQGNYHNTSKMGAIAPSSVTLLVAVCKEWLLWCF